MKEYLYLGHYYDTNGDYILKIGTTNDLKRRLLQHNQYYPRANKSPMRENEKFVYDWHLKLSHDNTLKYENIFKEMMKASKADYIANDRFRYKRKPKKIYVTIKKVYEVEL